jgi:hypothetical protein
MKEIKKDLFECIFDPEVDAICLTTNGNYTMSGVACMGGGCAGEAARRWPEVPKRLGKLLKTFASNIPYIIGAVDENANHLDLNAEMIKNKQFKCLIFSFPTINNLSEGSNIQLIKQSSTLMVDYANQYKLNKLATVRLGSGIGGLDWYEDVKPAVKDILDDRFLICCQQNDELRLDV